MSSIINTNEDDASIKVEISHDKQLNPMRIAVSVNHLSKTYPTPLLRLKRFFRRPIKPPVEALRDVTFDIRAGEIFGLIGRNGAGKTTLTKIIATLVQPTKGSVTVKDCDSVRDEESVRRNIGLATAEERSFYWRLTAEQNLLFFARLYGLSDRAARTRIAELFAVFQLEELARRRFGELSTGNKQRLAVARAMLAEPPVLLLDEPTRSLDPLAAANLRSVISSLAQQNPPVSILLTSHNLHEVEELCSRVAVISRGRIRAIDSPQNLRTLNQSRERVTISVRIASPENLRHALANELDGLEISAGQNDSAVFAFLHDNGDGRLDQALRLIHEHGGAVMDVEATRATLLDVLEGFESEGTLKEEAAQQ